MKKIIHFFIIASMTGVLVNCNKDTAKPCTAAVNQATLDAIPKTQLNTDISRITTYLASQNITNAVIDPSGLRYVITAAGTGDMPPCLETSVTVNYSGRTLAVNNTSLSANPFDASTSPATFPLNNLILGWEVAFLKLQKGCSATLFIPSGLGYGTAAPSSKIPANSVLVFQVDLVDFK